MKTPLNVTIIFKKKHISILSSTISITTVQLEINAWKCEKAKAWGVGFFVKSSRSCFFFPHFT